MAKTKKPLEPKKPKPEGYIFGRPTNYNAALGDRICELVATHPVGYETIRKLHPDIPMLGTVREWRLKFPDFNAKYLAAKAFQAELMVEEIDDILPGDIRTYFDERGNQRIDSPSAALAIAKCNNRKWTAARLAPKNYGDNKAVAKENDNGEVKEEMRQVREELTNKHTKEY